MASYDYLNARRKLNRRRVSEKSPRKSKSFRAKKDSVLCFTVSPGYGNGSGSWVDHQDKIMIKDRI